MKIPDNFVLLLFAAAVIIARHWVPELDSLVVLLLTLLRADQPMIPRKDRSPGEQRKSDES